MTGAGPSVVVFLGPSLDRATAESILPGATYLPPVAQADLVSALYEHHPRVVGIVDGYFHQRFAVWHKEVLHAFEHGVHVYGASSMGALRAAELAPFGMVGVGEVYRRFASGELDADDEVALVHGDADTDYRPLSLPLVNVRATVEQATAAGRLDPAVATRVVEVTQSLHYTDRDLPTIRERARDAGLPAHTVAQVVELLRHDYRDVKRDDAIALLRTIRDLPDDLPPKEIDYEVEHPAVMTAMLERDRTHDHDGVAVSHAELAYYTALHMPDFHQFNFDTLNRAITALMARRLGVTLDERAVDDEAWRLRLRLRITDDDDFVDWLDANDLTEDEFATLMEEVALCRRLHRWFVGRRHLVGTARQVVDGLRLDDTYTDWATRFADDQHLVTEDIHDAAKRSFLNEPLRDLVLDHLRSTDCRMDTSFTDWAWEAGFPNNNVLRVELERARQVRANRTTLLADLDALLAEPPDPVDDPSGHPDPS